LKDFLLLVITVDVLSFQEAQFMHKEITHMQSTHDYSYWALASQKQWKLSSKPDTVWNSKLKLA